MQYLASNIKYPVVAQENGVQGRVIVSFVVERDGSISAAEAVNSLVSTTTLPLRHLPLACALYS